MENLRCTLDDQIISNRDTVNNSEKICMHTGFDQWIEQMIDGVATQYNVNNMIDLE